MPGDERDDVGAPNDGRGQAKPRLLHVSSLPWDAPPCTCAAMCDEPDGCCGCCGGAGQDFGCGGMCWDCRGVGHTHPLDDPECPEHRLADGQWQEIEP